MTQHFYILHSCNFCEFLLMFLIFCIFNCSHKASGSSSEVLDVISWLETSAAEQNISTTSGEHRNLEEAFCQA